MYIFHENQKEISALDIDLSTDKYQKKIYFSNFEEFIKNFKENSQKNIFLLNEDRFSFYSTDINISAEKEITIKEFNEIIDKNILEYNKKAGHGASYISYDIDNIFVDGKSVNYIINQKGKIYFRLNLIFLISDTVNVFKKTVGNKFQNNNKFFVYPTSFFTMKFIRKTLKTMDFNMLYIDDYSCKLIDIKNGFYKDTHVVNLGKDTLKDIYKDNNILSLFHNIESEISDFNKDLVCSSIDFYSDMLSKWMKEYLKESKNIVLISDLVKSKYFIEILGKSYSKYVNGYIIPFNHSDSLKTYGRKRMKSNLDILTYVNSL